MNEEGFEEWDADFLDQLIQVEELALSTQNPNPIPLIPSHPPTASTIAAVPSSVHHHQQHHFGDAVSYSPPRELSQRPRDFNDDAFDRFANGFPQCGAVPPPPSTSLSLQEDAKDLEIDRLKRELGHVSRQLKDLERECFGLRKERNLKEKINSVNLHSEESDKVAACFKNANLENGLHKEDTCGSLRQARNAKSLEDNTGYGIGIVNSSKATIGVQTEIASDYRNVDSEDNRPSFLDLSKKLLGIWGSTSDQSLGRNLVSKLFTVCQGDFHVLFGSMKMDASSVILVNSASCGSSFDFALQDLHSCHTSEAAKVSHLYAVLTKVSNGILPLDSLFEPLLDLCNLKNVLILRSSLSVLHALLRHLLSLGRKFEDRDNVMVEGLHFGNDTEGRGPFFVSSDESSYTGCTSAGKPSDLQFPCKKMRWNVNIVLSRVNWVSLFDLMHQIAVNSTEECVILEAISIMNLVLIRSHAYTERESFGQISVFESIAKFLKKEAGSNVQKEALYLLYLLLNCPKLLSLFNSCCEEGESENGANDASIIKAFNFILEGLADCITCGGSSVKDIELRKRAIMLLAFLASSGKLGFEILVSHKLHGEANLLMLILQVLVSEMDIEASVTVEPIENVKARTFFIREALILLNRLVSNPGYSVTYMQVLTASRDMASLTIEIASRLSCKEQRLQLSDSLTSQVRDAEIVDLARVFRKRIFGYL